MEPGGFTIHASSVCVYGELIRLWGQRNREAVSHMETILENYRDFYQRAAAPIPESIIPNLKCVAYYLDNKFYRCRVVSLVNKLVTVHAIDYGFQFTVDYRNLRIPSALEIPFHGAEDLAEAFFVAEVGQSLKLDSAKLQDIVHNELICKILADHGRNFKIARFTTATGANLAKRWVIEGCVIEIPFYKQQQLVSSYSDGTSESTSHRMHHPAPFEPTPRQEARREAPNEGTRRTTTKPVNAPHFYFSVAPPIGILHKANVTHVMEGPFSFSVQLTNDLQSLKTLTDDLELMEKIPIKGPIVIGKPCIAFSVNLNHYCRSVIVNVSHDFLRVSLVDYGSLEDLSVKHIFEAPAEALDTKLMAHTYSLAGLNRLKTLNSAELRNINEIFTSIVLHETLLLQPVEPDENCVQCCELFLGSTNVKEILNQKRKMKKVTYAAEPFPEVGWREVVYISSVDNPRRFFVQRHGREAELKNLKVKLNALGGNSPLIPKADLKPGLPCLAQYPGDELWYRAKVLSVAEDHVTIIYVDYGSTHNSDKSVLRELPSNLVTCLPALAMCCAISASSNLQTSSALMDSLTQLLLNILCEIVIVEVVEKSHMIVRLEVDGCDIVQRLTGPSFTDTTTKLPPRRSSVTENDDWTSEAPSGFPRRRPKIPSDGSNWGFPQQQFRSTGVSRIEFKRFPRDRMQDDNNFGRNKGGGGKPRFDERVNGRRGRESENNGVDSWENMQSEKSYEHMPRRNDRGDERRRNHDDRERGGGKNRFNDHNDLDSRSDGSDGFKRRFQREGDAGRRDRPNKRRNDFENDVSSGSDAGWQRNDSGGKRFDSSHGASNGDSRPKRMPIRNEDRAPPGSEYEMPIFVPGAIEDVVLTYFVTPSEFYLQTTTNKDSFTSLMNQIQSDYSNKFGVRDINALQESEVVIAKFSADRVLYRAEVLSTSPLKVRFVDYGNVDVIASNREVYPMTKKALELPRQAIRCSLKGATPIGESWTGEESGPFDRENFTCTFHDEINGTYEVSLYTDDNCCVVDQLVTAGLAKPDKTLVDKDIVPVANDLLLGQTIIATAPYIEGVDKFYIQIHPQSVTNMEEMIAARFKSPKECTVMNAVEVLPNKLCLSCAGQQTLFRARITELTESGLWVQYIDYGDYSEISFSEVYEIPEELAKYAPLVTECYLIGDTTNITDEAQDKLKSDFEGNKIIVTFMEAVGSRFGVSIYDLQGIKLDIQTGVNDAPEECPLLGLPLTAAEIDVVAFDFDLSSKLLIKLPSCCDILLNDSYNDDVIENVVIPSGELAAALCADGHWRRCQIECDNEVYLIDLGRIEKATVLRPLLPALRTQPCAIRAVSAPWPFLGTNRVKIRREDDNFVVEPVKKAAFISFVEYSNKIHVNPALISDRLDEIQASISNSVAGPVPGDDKLVVARYLEDDTWYRAFILSHTPLCVNFIDYGNQAEVEEIAPMPASLTLVPPLSVSLTIPLDLPGSAQSDLEEIVLKTTEPLTVIETNGELVDLLLEGCSLLSKLAGRTIINVGDEVYISHAISPKDFYVQRSEDSDRINELNEKMMLADTFEEVSDPQNDGLLAAKFVDDEQWYRGRIIDGQVFFVDHGNYADLSDIRKLPDELADLQPFAAHVCLIHPSGGEWSDSATEALLEITGEEALTVMEVTFQDGINRVCLIHNGKDVAAEIFNDSANVAETNESEVIRELDSSAHSNNFDGAGPSTSSLNDSWPTREQTDDDKFAGLNETDEQKRGKMDDCKCDDEKTETLTEIENVPDSELEETEVNSSNEEIVGELGAEEQPQLVQSEENSEVDPDAQEIEPNSSINETVGEIGAEEQPQFAIGNIELNLVPDCQENMQNLQITDGYDEINGENGSNLDDSSDRSNTGTPDYDESVDSGNSTQQLENQTDDSNNCDETQVIPNASSNSKEVKKEQGEKLVPGSASQERAPDEDPPL